VVEHDLSFIKHADYIIEMGPQAGSLGGEVVYQGKLSEIDKVKTSVTHQLIQKNEAILDKAQTTKGKAFGLKGAVANNLKSIDVDFYAQQITAINGVSGSGKSSLIKEVLNQSWLKKRPTNCKSMHGFDQFTDVLLIDQQAISQSRLSTLVSYSGIIDQLKAIFSKTEVAIEKGLKKADFSYQSKNGKCTTCGGQGQLKTSMDFMSDIWLTCDVCKGKRYNDAIIACQYQDHSIGDVLGMTVLEAINFFESGVIVDQLNVLKQVGVGHLLLGQSITTLSGGEGQRLKLATSMLGKRKGATLYLFDEPSTGLHYFDILKLIKIFQSLVQQGDTVLFIEHNKVLIESANQIITLGPKSGENGGEIMN
jgi:excinuclease ABC subunit A